MKKNCYHKNDVLLYSIIKSTYDFRSLPSKNLFSFNIDSRNIHFYNANGHVRKVNIVICRNELEPFLSLHTTIDQQRNCILKST